MLGVAPSKAAVAAVAAMIVLSALPAGVALNAAAQSGVTAGCTVDGGPGGSGQQVGAQRFSGEQLAIAQVITTVAQQRGLPQRAAVLAVATGIVESGLRNLAYGDRDSLGVFQQRPSQGWGSAEQITNPGHAAGVFYDHLLALPGWATLPPGTAEQAVQRSAFPDRYGPQEAAAAALVAKFWTGPDNPVPPDGHNSGQHAAVPVGCGDQGASNLPVTGQGVPPGFVLPADPQAAAAVAYALAQVGKPYVWGAAGPDSFDCSGLVMAAWAHAGVAIPRTTTAQLQAGVAVGSTAVLEPGDLLFIPGSLGTPAAPGHVGLYAGTGVVVDAFDDHTGVITESVQSWADHVVAVRRVAHSTTQH